MELSGCQNMIRLIFIFFNGFILLAGIVTLGLGIWAAVIADSVSEVLSEEYSGSGPILITVGILIIALAIIGIIGACGKWRILIAVFLVMLVITIVIEVAGVGYSFAKAEDLDHDQIVMDLQRALLRYYPSNSSMYNDDLNDVIDAIQEGLECCGVNNTADWQTSPYYLELNQRLPSSCCGRDEPAFCSMNDAYDDGCSETLRDLIEENIIVGAIVGLIFAIFEILLLLMSIYLIVILHEVYIKA